MELSLAYAKFNKFDNFIALNTMDNYKVFTDLKFHNYSHEYLYTYNYNVPTTLDPNSLGIHLAV